MEIRFCLFRNGMCEGTVYGVEAFNFLRGENFEILYMKRKVSITWNGQTLLHPYTHHRDGHRFWNYSPHSMTITVQYNIIFLLMLPGMVSDSCYYGCLDLRRSMGCRIGAMLDEKPC